MSPSWVRTLEANSPPGYGVDCFLSAIEDAHGFFDGGGSDGVGACAFGWTATCAFGAGGGLPAGLFPIPPSKANP
jgi:hypothetical protein